MAMTAHEIGEELASVFGQTDFAFDNGVHFACFEANVIAGVLLETGHREAAETWLRGHAFGDLDQGDEHDGLVDSNGDERGDRVQKYLDGMNE